jgi:glutathione S-transferase
MDISPPARSSLMVIRNLKLKVEIIDIDLLKGDHLKDNFLKLNPLHQIPVLIDGDYVLSESRAIATYLVNSKNPGCSLYPSNPKIRGLIDQRLYFDATEVFPRNCSIIRSFFEEQEYVIPEYKKQRVQESMTLLDHFLEGRKWFVGENYTLADISIITNVLQIKVNILH